ncbi:MAG: DNA repair protein RadC [Chloroflexota bacterium]|nr:DNA repair protein RadC [Chloroflexota bacterium]
MKDSFTVRDLPSSERPRERLLRMGEDVLSTQEILALVLGKGVKGESVMLAAQRLLSTFGNLQGIANASSEELMRLKGIGPAKAAQLKASFELGRRIECGDMQLSPSNVVSNPKTVVKHLSSRLRGKKKEHFWVLLLNTRNQVIRDCEISVGSLDASIVHPREVFKEAITASAASVLFVHNHPSGDPTPSQEDVELTKRLVEVGDLVGIEVLDHVIVGSKEYVSLKSRMLM